MIIIIYEASWIRWLRYSRIIFFPLLLFLFTAFLYASSPPSPPSFLHTHTHTHTLLVPIFVNTPFVVTFPIIVVVQDTFFTDNDAFLSLLAIVDAISTISASSSFTHYYFHRYFRFQVSIPTSLLRTNMCNNRFLRCRDLARD